MRNLFQDTESRLFFQIITDIKGSEFYKHHGSSLMPIYTCKSLVIMPLSWPAVALAATRGGKVRHMSVCVLGQHVQLQSLCVNEQRHAFSHYHSASYSLSLSPSLNSCSPDNTPPSSPIPFEKPAFSPLWELVVRRARAGGQGGKGPPD